MDAKRSSLCKVLAGPTCQRYPGEMCCRFTAATMMLDILKLRLCALFVTDTLHIHLLFSSKNISFHFLLSSVIAILFGMCIFNFDLIFASCQFDAESLSEHLFCSNSVIILVFQFLYTMLFFWANTSGNQFLLQWL